MNNITYLDDIAKELAEEHGLDYKEALEICKLSIDFTYEQMKDPNIISIRFPNLGVLHFNVKRAKYSYRNSRSFKHLVEILDKQINFAESLQKKIKDLAHTRNSFYSQFRKYFFPNRKERSHSSKKEVFRKIEIKQNS